MKIAAISVYTVAAFLAILQGFADTAILLWPLCVLLFFGDRTKLVGLTFIIGFFVDLYSPVFGLYTILFPLTLLCGILLLNTVFSHQTHASLQGVSFILILLFSVLEYSFFLLHSWLLPQSSPSFIPLQSFVAVRFLIILFQIPVLLIASLVAQRTQKRFGYSVDGVTFLSNQ